MNCHHPMSTRKPQYVNQTGWTAIFNGTDTEIGRMVRVEGWDQTTGTALVVDPKRGALRAVTDYEDFSHLERADQVVAAVPGGGWRVHWKDEGPGGTPLTEQVLAWLITSQGRATAITVDAQGHVEDADGADAFIPRGEGVLIAAGQATSFSRSMAWRRFLSR
ncbi:hypothetical protein [Streptomyces cinereoruber]|uniref:hypothetical protein n=1 Tax=Streptomyces cinereoruber TaxID=67260 RepID=UPI00364044F0